MYPRKTAPRLPGFCYSAGHWYFITVVTRRRRKLLSVVEDGVVRPTQLGQVVLGEWHERPLRFPGVTLDLEALMPDHFHAILGLPGGGPELARIVGSFKAATSRVTGVRGSLWQRSFFDRIIRNQRELDTLRKYVAENGLRWCGLRPRQVAPWAC